MLLHVLMCVRCVYVSIRAKSARESVGNEEIMQKKRKSENESFILYNSKKENRCRRIT